MHDLIHYENEILQDILKLLDIETLYKLMCHPVSKSIYNISKNYIDEIKITTPIYTRILSSIKSKDEMNALNLIFFKLNYFRSHFRDFKKYIFFIMEYFEKDEFILVSKLYKLYYLKKIDENTAILVFNNDNDNVYFSLLESKVRFENTHNIPQSGYLIFHGEKQPYSDKILSLIK